MQHGQIQKKLKKSQSTWFWRKGTPKCLIRICQSLKLIYSTSQRLQSVLEALPFLDGKLSRCQIPIDIPNHDRLFPSRTLLSNWIQSNFFALWNPSYQKCPRRNWWIQAWRVHHLLFRNYGPTIAVGNQAQKQGHQQVLWLWNNKIGEIGSSNIFFVLTDKKTKKRKVITPALEDLVLPGVTRDSIIVFFN